MLRNASTGCALALVVVVVGCGQTPTDTTKARSGTVKTAKPEKTEFHATPGGVKQLLSTVGAPLSRKAWDEITSLVKEIEGLAREVAHKQNGARSMKKRAEFIEKMGAKRRDATPDTEVEERRMIAALEGRAKLLEGEADDLTRDLVTKRDRMRAIVRFDLRRNGYRARFGEKGQLEGYQRSGVDS